MKTLATCKPTEFLKQANRIKKHAEKWMKDTNIIGFYETLPELKIVPAGATTEERLAIAAENKKRANEQSRKNMSRIFDSCLEEHPEETLQLLALCCFIEPEHVDDYTVEDYLTALSELLDNGAVLSFFTSVARLGQTTSSVVSKQ